MLKTVGGNFVNFFLAYCSLVLAFALSFNVLFPEEEAFVHPISSFMKTLVMMTGELEYNDLYYPISEKLDFNGIRDSAPPQELFRWKCEKGQTW